MTTLYVNGVPFLDQPEMVLMDKDGTLIDIHHYWSSMIRLRAARIVKVWFKGRGDSDDVMARLIDAMGVNLATGRMKPEGPVGVKPRPFIVQVATSVVQQAGVEMDEARMESLFAEIDQQTATDPLPLLRLLPGASDFLKQLSALGIAAAVVSTDITHRATWAMQALKIDQYFRVIVGGDAVAHTKPAGDLAQAALAHGAHSARHSLVIGDHPVDIQMGMNAGLFQGIGVLTGLSDCSAFKNLDCVTVPDLTHLAVR